MAVSVLIVEDDRNIAELLLTDPEYAKTLADNALKIREKLTSREIFVSWYRYLFEEEPKEL